MADEAPESMPASSSDESMSEVDSDSGSDDAAREPTSNAPQEVPLQSLDQRSAVILVCSRAHMTFPVCVQGEAGDSGGKLVRAHLVVVGDAVRLRMDLQHPHSGSRIGSMADSTARMGIVDVRQRAAVGPPISSDSDVSSDSEEELPMVDVLADIRARLDEAVDEDVDDKGTSVNCVLDDLPPVELLDVDIDLNDDLVPAGRVASVLEGIVIVQVPELGRVFDEGTVLCLEDRTPLGRVTEVFGPIQAPLYALRYSGNPGAPPDSVTPGAHVCAVAKYALALEPDIVQQRAPNLEEEVEQEDPSFQFSDDEQEAAFQQNLAQRPAVGAVGIEASGGFERSRQQTSLVGRGRDAGGGHGSGGFMKRQGGRGRAGRQGPPRGLHPAAAGQAAAGMSFGGMSPGPPQRPEQLHRQGWSGTLPQQPAYNSPPAAFSSPMQFGGVQQLPDGSFVLPVAQQVVLTPQQMQQLQQTGHLPSQFAPFLPQQGMHPPAPCGGQQYSPQFMAQPHQFVGPPMTSQAYQMQLSAQQTQQVLAPASQSQHLSRPVRPPPRPLYRTGL